MEAYRTFFLFFHSKHSDINKSQTYLFFNPMDHLTPLCIAAGTCRSARLIIDILAAGGDINQPSRDGLTPLIIALRRTSPAGARIALELLRLGADVFGHVDNAHSSSIAGRTYPPSSEMLRYVSGTSPTTVRQRPPKEDKEEEEGEEEASELSDAIMARVDAEGWGDEEGDADAAPRPPFLSFSASSVVMASSVPNASTNASLFAAAPIHKPLCVAVVTAKVSGNTAVVEALIRERGADVNAACRNGWTPLLHAVREDSAPLVKLLLANGAAASANATDVNGFSPLYFAISQCNAELVRLLLAAGADPNDGRFVCGHPPLVLAAKTHADWLDRQALIRRRLKGRAHYLCDVKKPSASAAEHTSRNKNKNNNNTSNNSNSNDGSGDLTDASPSTTEIAMALIAAGANVNAVDAGGDTALTVAIRTRHVALASAVLSSPSFDPSTAHHCVDAALIVAVEAGDEALARRCVALGANPDGVQHQPARRESATPFSAFLRRHATACGYTCGPNALVGSVGDCKHSRACVYGRSPLGVAVQRRSFQLVVALLELGASPNAPTALITHCGRPNTTGKGSAENAAEGTGVPLTVGGIPPSAAISTTCTSSNVAQCDESYEGSRSVSGVGSSGFCTDSRRSSSPQPTATAATNPIGLDLSCSCTGRFATAKLSGSAPFAPCYYSGGDTYPTTLPPLLLALGPEGCDRVALALLRGGADVLCGGAVAAKMALLNGHPRTLDVLLRDPSAALLSEGLRGLVAPLTAANHEPAAAPPAKMRSDVVAVLRRNGLVPLLPTQQMGH